MARQPSADTPQKRQRSAQPVKTLFTVAMGGHEVQRKFLFKQRLVFTAFGALGLGAMWLTAFLRLPLPSWASWVALALGLFSWWLSGTQRLHRPGAQVTLSLLAFLLVGAAAGLGLASSFFPWERLQNLSVLVGGLLVGCTLNTLFFRQPPSPARQFLLIGPWLLLSALGIFFFSDSEWVLLSGGTLGLFLDFLALRAEAATLQLYQVKEIWSAAADLVPLNLWITWNR